MRPRPGWLAMAGASEADGHGHRADQGRGACPLDGEARLEVAVLAVGGGEELPRLSLICCVSAPTAAFVYLIIYCGPETALARGECRHSKYLFRLRQPSIWIVGTPLIHLHHYLRDNSRTRASATA